MLSNKMLRISELYFNLPDDFTGTVGDALKLLADYRLKSESENNVNKYPNDEIDSYKEIITDKNIKCSLKYNLMELNKETNKWENLKPK